jgi:5,5'-dehydrodivanillate O-demethylase
MLSAQENERLTQVGPGTPMGELLRRYWHPIAPAAELDAKPTKAVKVLGEELALYRDASGTYGLIDRYCPHRLVDLSYGIPEQAGLRCMYHGWLFDETGACTEQPFEETVHPDGRFREKTGIAAYPVQECAGLLFAYLGPAPAPLLPRWEPLAWENAVRDIAIAELPCSWLQCQENSLDPVHVEWLHSYMGARVNAQRNPGTAAVMRRPHQRIGFDRYANGIVKRRIIKDGSEQDDDWKQGHPVLFPHILLVGSEVRMTLQWRVPVDDEHTYHVTLYSYQAAPGAHAPAQERVPYRYVPLFGPDGRYILDVTFNQDYMAWIGQGPVADRTREKLGESDVGIVLFRRMLTEQMGVVADGGDPVNTFRDAAEAAHIPAPMEQVKFGARLGARYVPQEAGETTAAPDIQRVLDTWVSNWEAAGTGAGR